jgi:hypothetical protein
VAVGRLVTALCRNRFQVDVATAAVATVVALAVVACGGSSVRDTVARSTSGGSVAFAPNSDWGAFEISAKGVSCDTARAIAKSSQGVDYDPPNAKVLTYGGFNCQPSETSRGMMEAVYRCGRTNAVVSFTRAGAPPGTGSGLEDTSTCQDFVHADEADEETFVENDAALSYNLATASQGLGGTQEAAMEFAHGISDLCSQGLSVGSNPLLGQAVESYKRSLASTEAGGGPTSIP